MTIQTLQGALQQSIRNALFCNNDFNGDLHALCDWYGVPAAPISGRLIGVARLFDASITDASSALNYFLQNPNRVPALALDFTASDTLDSRITFSRGSQATLFDSSGVLRYAKHNLLLQSQDFATTWINSSSTEQTDVAVAPDGTTTADALVDTADAVNTTHLTQQTLSFVAGIQYTFSVYAKADTLPGIQILLPSAAFTADQRANYDCTNGTVANVSGTATLSIISVGNGWYRCVMQATATTSASGLLQIRTIKNVSGSLTSFYIGDGAGKSLIWGGQLNLANMIGGVTASIDTYYPTTTAAYYAGRARDYDPVTLAPRGFLIEEQRTNSIRNNTMQGASAGVDPTNWAGLNATSSGVTISSSASGNENGIAYVDVTVTGTATTTGTLFAPRFDSTTQIAASSGQTWTESFYCTLQSGILGDATFSIRIDEFDSGGGALTQGTGPNLSPATGQLRNARFSFSRANTNASTAFICPRFRIAVVNGTAYNFTLRIGLPQLELGAFATSVIPTSGTALTRNADVASMTGTDFSSWFNASEGTVFVQAQSPAVAGVYYYYSINNGTSNEIRLASGSGGGNPTFNTTIGGVSQASMSVSLSAGSLFKAASAYKVDSFNSSVNGALGTEDTSGNLPTVVAISIGGRSNSTLFTNGHIQRIAYYPVRLANATLQALTT